VPGLLNLFRRRWKGNRGGKELPGFVTSRMNALIGNEASTCCRKVHASARDIDSAKLGRTILWPFEMIDLVGLDTQIEHFDFST
jgi:3-hydroxybutyryl-CoA dehydrogenase